MGFLDKVKAGAAEATAKVKDGAEDVQAKREIGKLYDELGRKTHELVNSGAVSNPEIEALTARIDALQAKVDDAADAPAESAEPAAASAPAPPDG